MRKAIILSCVLLGFMPTVVLAVIHADTVWEVRDDATANNVNGGGFNPSNATPGTDYSQQDAAEDSGTDLTCTDGDAAAPVIASASHNFVDADEGNIIHITEAGDGFTVGWYEIVSTNANTATLDRACGTDGAKTGGDWYLGGALSLASTLDDDWFDVLVVGNTVYISGLNAENTTYTLGEAVSILTNGTSAAPIIFIGYKAARGDNPTLTYRPSIDTGANVFTTSNYNIFRNVAVTGTGTSTILLNDYSVANNCKATNTSLTANRNAWYPDAYCKLVGCEGVSAAGRAFATQSAGTVFVACTARDSDTGILLGNNNAVIIGCVIDTCTTYGISTNSRYALTIVNSTIYNCGTGVEGSTGYTNLFLNNIIDGCTDGAAWTTQSKIDWWDYNVWDNTDDVDLVTQGDNDITGDPGMANAATGDFTVGSGSNVLSAGLSVGASTGLTGTYKQNIGVDQDDNTAGGGTDLIGVIN